MSTALLFPGQGSQRPAMLQSLPQSPAAAQTWAEAQHRLARLDGLPGQLDTAEALQSTTNAQLSLLIAGVAYARALVDDHGLQAEFVAGHSVGAFAAAVLTGVLSLTDAIAVVRVRGDEMQRACAGRHWGMAALSGLGLPGVRSLVNSHGTVRDPLWVANVNAADQTVISGTAAALENLRGAAESAGARDLAILDVGIASHCPLQAGTAEAVAAELRRVRHGSQQRAYLANRTGRRLHHDPAGVIDDLAQAVQHPVQWFDGMRLLGELGVTTTVEVPPGHVLTSLALRTLPDVNAVALDEVGIDAALRRARVARPSHPAAGA
jgi:malonate decarboxylase epsilon subunit